jgi:hypothetical protein
VGTVVEAELDVVADGAIAPEDCDAWAGFNIPVIALRVFGVIVAGVGLSWGGAEEEFVTMARKAAVFGDGGGKLTGPPTRGVRPVLGVSPVLPKGLV